MEIQLNPTEIDIYGINAFINNFKNPEDEYELNLDILKKKFKIDNKLDKNGEYDVMSSKELPSFTQLTYNKKINKVLDSYSRPAIGPIENYCYCSKCYKIGPNYHKENCNYPINRSLYLTFDGLHKLVIPMN